MLYFLDTNILLTNLEEIQNMGIKFYISNITLYELEHIKTNVHKTEDVKYAARQVLHFLEGNQDKFEIIPYKEEYLKELPTTDLPNTNDSKIVATAYAFTHNSGLAFPIDKKVFLTNDLSCKYISKSLGILTESIAFNQEEYHGFIEVQMDEEELSDFYTEIFPNNINKYNLYTNEYLLIKDDNNKIKDKYRWTGSEYAPIPYVKFESKMFGKVAPKDDYQLCAMDSLIHNQLNILRGDAGSGKSLISLAYLFQELEKNHIDKIVMFVNPVATKDSCKFGFLPGTFLEKVLGSQIGNFLASKLGAMEIVHQLISQGKLEFIALADARGYDTSDMNCGIYMTESQNANIEMMKLILSRIGENTPCILEGDNNMQTDVTSYGGGNNGLRRACEVFKGEDYFGAVTLQKCYRSKIADRALSM